MINGREADIVIFGGNLLDNYARDRERLDLKYLQEELNKTEAKVGKYAVFGNHDYGGGAVRIYADFMNGCGFHVLDVETVFLPNGSDCCRCRNVYQQRYWADKISVSFSECSGDYRGESYQKRKRGCPPLIPDRYSISLNQIEWKK